MSTLTTSLDYIKPKDNQGVRNELTVNDVGTLDKP